MENRKTVHPIDKNKPNETKAAQPTMDAKTTHIIEAANLAMEYHNIQKRLKAIDTRVGELSYILMTMEQMELNSAKGEKPNEVN